MKQFKEGDDVVVGESYRGVVAGEPGRTHTWIRWSSGKKTVVHNDKIRRVTALEAMKEAVDEAR